MNKQNRNRLIDTENRLVIFRGRGGWGGWVKRGEGSEKYRLVVTKESWGCQLEHRR